MKDAVVIIGMQWGDEGKGKIVDVFAQKADFVVRFNGGNNAGHTVVVEGRKFPMSLLPSGVLRQKKLLLAQGVVITPDILLKEISFIESLGLIVDLTIDKRCNIVMPYHKLLDTATEEAKGNKKVGSLKLGIGYCYEDRNNRHGIRMTDLANPKILQEKIEQEYPKVKKRIESVYGYKVELKASEIFEEYKSYGIKLKKNLGDVSDIIITKLHKKKILFEGAHGTFLDANFGTYPYTTAVNTISGSVFSYVGFPPQKLDVVGIIKAYTTRVGGGPFPTELFNDTGSYIQEKGEEFGTVSKRKRRCGWLDIVMLKYAQKLNGCNSIAITKLDVLSGLPELKIATHYMLGDKKIYNFPVLLEDIEKCQPVYKKFGGWDEDLTKIKKCRDLPKNCRVYLEAIEEMLNVPIRLISVGADREAIININYLNKYYAKTN